MCIRDRRSAVQADAKLLEAAPKLRIIGRAGVGVDNIDAAEATRRGIVVMNTPGANAVAVAAVSYTHLRRRTSQRRRGGRRGRGEDGGASSATWTASVA